MPGRFRCYSCGYEHRIREKTEDYSRGLVFERGISCPESAKNMQEKVDESEFYKKLHEIPHKLCGQA
jgi:hypothetical protein